MKKIILSIIFSALTTSNIFAQFHSLSVFDFETKKPISYALVYDSLNKHTFITNEHGQVNLPKNSSKVNISHLSYQSQSISICSDTTVFLDAKPFQLNELTVKVKSISAYDVVRKAKEMISINFIQEKVSTDIFYREEKNVVLSNAKDTLNSVIEAAFLCNHNGYKTSKPKRFELQKARVVQLRNQTNEDSILIKTLTEFKIKGGIFDCFKYDLSDLSEVDFLFNIKNYKFEFEESTDSNLVIKFSPLMKKAKYEGRIIISKSDFSILYIYAKRKEVDFMKFGMSVWLKDDYEAYFNKYSGKMYPLFLKTNRTIKLKINEQEGEFNQSLTGFITKIHKKYTQVKREFKQNQDFNPNVMLKYRNDFWEDGAPLLPSFIK